MFGFLSERSTASNRADSAEKAMSTAAGVPTIEAFTVAGEERCVTQRGKSAEL
ncbi:hypothetical protein QT383_16925 [Stenotrophomonas rhizophila]